MSNSGGSDILFLEVLNKIKIILDNLTLTSLTTWNKKGKLPKTDSQKYQGPLKGTVVQGTLLADIYITFKSHEENCIFNGTIQFW